MKISVSFCLSFLTLLSCYACSVAPKNQLASIQPENPVIVTMGGFNSCTTDANGRSSPEGTDRWQKSEQLSGKFATAEQRWLRSCFDSSGNIFYVSSNSPKVIVRALSDNPKALIDEIATLTLKTKAPLFLLGHSHGGWLAMLTSKSLPDAVKIKLLITVDPISPKNCGPSTYYSAIMKLPIGGGSIAGCQEAPADFSESHHEAILNRIADKNWIHFYQQNFYPLHSSAIRGRIQPSYSADLSPYLSVTAGGAHGSYNAHTGIDELNAVWYGFEARIENALKG